MVKKIRLIEPGNNSPYKKSLANAFVYNKYLRNPSTGLNILATIAKGEVEDVLMYSESISTVVWQDVLDADMVFLSLNTFNAVRGYQLADKLCRESNAVVVLGGMHASLNYEEAVEHAHYVLLGDGDESIVDLIQAVNGGQPVEFPGVVCLRDGELVHTGHREPPENIDIIPNRHLVYNYAYMASRYDTLWPQVHASRGCPHSCAYCAVIAHFGRRIRKRSPENVVEDIRQAIEFHKRRFIPRLSNCLWITDDNFPEDREWAISVLRAIIDSGIKYRFSVQARYELGFDNELLELMRQAGFIEVAMGIEFLDDESFREYGKKSSYDEIKRSIQNIKKHGIAVRGLFIVGADRDTVGVGDKLADYVIENGIHGCLIQSMFFTPGTSHFEENKHRLLHQNWEKYNGNVVHYPANIKPHQLQREIIHASRKIYSPKRLLQALLHSRGIFKVLFFGEFLWHRNIRRELAADLPYLESLSEKQPQAEGEAAGAAMG